MHSKLLAAAGIAALVIFMPARADASCCDQAKHASHAMTAGMPCCNGEADMKCCAEPDAIAMLMQGQDLLDPQWAPAPPARQATEVWFQRPVRSSLVVYRECSRPGNERENARGMAEQPSSRCARAPSQPRQLCALRANDDFRAARKTTK